MFRYLRSERGVTLIELMVVVAIIAIIAAIAITLYQDVQKKAKLAADQGTLAAIRSAIAIYYGKNNGVFPAAPGTYVTPAPAWQCTGQSLAYSSANGVANLVVTDASGC